MFKKGNNMKNILLITTALILMMGCETGVKNQAKKTVEVPSGIVDKRDVKTVNSSIFKTSNNASNASTTSKGSIHKIFSKSAQPGFYLQYAVFQQYRPDKNFLKPLNSSKFNYIVLNKSTKDYVLIGPYKSYNQAHGQIHGVKTYLHKQTFVIEVLRP